MKSYLLKKLQDMVGRGYVESNERSYDWAGRRIAALSPRRLLDVGCGDGSRLFAYLRHTPEEFCGVEGHPDLARRATACGLRVSSFDLNGRWPFPDHSFDAIHASQVIEHIHNTRLFLVEARRILAPGGTIVITSENLSSLLNWTALSLGYAPFSLQQVCGWYVGNPLGLHAQEKIAIESVDTTDAAHPAFSGMFGHIRVLTVLQAQDLLRQMGFENIVVRSIGMMPLPTCLGRPLERWFTRRGHWLLMEARAPS